MSFGKKILSAFVEIEEDEKEDESQTHTPKEVVHKTTTTIKENVVSISTEDEEKFKSYFNKLLNDSKSSGPDYFSFSKMIEAMTIIADEKARYIAAFAGLAAQGLSKTKLIESATQLLDVLENDSTHFNNTINAALEEKVEGKKKSIEEKTKKIQELSRDISDLDNEISLLKLQLAESEEKIQISASGYMNESNALKNKMNQEIDKIKQYLN